MTLSGYLKLYQLTKPQIKGFDLILVDEAQDLTPGNQLNHAQEKVLARNKAALLLVYL